MSNGVGEALEHPDAARGGALMRDSKRMAVVSRLVDDPSEEFLRLVGAFVQTDACEDDERSRSKGPWLERGDDFPKPCLRPARIAGLKVKDRGLHRAAH